MYTAAGDAVMELGCGSSQLCTQLLSWRRLNGDCKKNDDRVNLPDQLCQISESHSWWRVEGRFYHTTKTSLPPPQPGQAAAMSMGLNAGLGNNWGHDGHEHIQFHTRKEFPCKVGHKVKLDAESA
ncbi:hypothetical protein Tco_0459610 [Tanacetum coccineum]